MQMNEKDMIEKNVDFFNQRFRLNNMSPFFCFDYNY